MKKLFTPEELEELRRADAEIDESFRQTQEEIRQSQVRDRQAQLAAMEPEKRKKAIRRAAYYQANREKYNAWQRENTGQEKEPPPERRTPEAARKKFETRAIIAQKKGKVKWN